MRFRGIVTALLVSAAIGACSSFGSSAAEDTKDAGAPVADATTPITPIEAGTAPEAGSSPDAGPPLSYVQTVLADKPLAYWRMVIPQNGAATVHDESGKGNYLAWNGPVLQVDGPLHGAGDIGDMALNFDGQSNYAQALLGDALPPVTTVAPELTIECWIKRPAADQNAPTLRVMVSDYNASGGTHYEAYEGVTDGTFVAEYELADNGSSQVVSSPLAPADTWTHYAIVFDGSTVTTYANGIVAGSGQFGAARFEWAMGRTFRVGVSAKTGYGFWLGAIDEIAIYDKALSAGQLLSHVNAAQAH